jgi:hypothetical protein
LGSCFFGIKGEWPIWNEIFLAKTKHSGVKDILLGNVVIPKRSYVIEEKTEEGKEMMRAVESNEIAFTELVLSINVISSKGEIAFEIVKSYKTKDFEGGNAALS